MTNKMKQTKHNNGASWRVGDREYDTWEVPDGKGGTAWRACFSSISGNGGPGDIRLGATLAEVITLFPENIQAHFTEHYKSNRAVAP